MQEVPNIGKVLHTSAASVSEGEVHLEGGSCVPFDFLVLASGSTWTDPVCSGTEPLLKDRKLSQQAGLASSVIEVGAILGHLLVSIVLGSRGQLQGLMGLFGIWGSIQSLIGAQNRGDMHNMCMTPVQCCCDCIQLYCCYFVICSSGNSSSSIVVRVSICATLRTTAIAESAAAAEVPVAGSTQICVCCRSTARN